MLFVVKNLNLAGLQMAPHYNMALITRNMFIGLSVLITIISADIYVYSRILDRGIKARIFRVHFVLILQAVMLLLSYFLWRRFNVFFDTFHPTGKMKVESGATTTTHIYQRIDSPSSSLLSFGAIPQLKHDNEKVMVKVKIWRIFLLLYLFTCHFSYVTNLFFIGTEPYFVGMITYTCLGSFIQLIAGTVFIQAFALISKFIPKGDRNGKLLSSARTKIVFAVVYSLSISMYGVHTASKPPSIKQVVVPVRGLPKSFEGMTIVQLSDIHLGPTVGRSRVETIVTMANKLKPDMLVLTGDLVDGSVVKLHRAAEPIQKITTKYGKFFISGNHEYYTGDVDNWFEYLASIGVTPLHNSHINIYPTDDGPGHLCIAGTDDIEADRIGYMDHGMDLDKAVESCDPQLPTILLAHQPKAAKRALDSKYRIDLVLSGHTHGGQMFPLTIGAYLINPFYAGLYKYGPDSHVYVSMGTMYWGIPMRIFTSHEITYITLTAS